MAMHLAVSTLSPVSIHILTPPIRSASMVMATSSCNLSSTPVMPTKSIYFYSFYMTFMVVACLSLRTLQAYSY